MSENDEAAGGAGSKRPPATGEEIAREAYGAAVAALRLADALNARPGPYIEDSIAGAAATALKASLAALLLVVTPGGEQEYYAFAAEEIYTDMFTEGRGVADAVEGFTNFGFQHLECVYRPGHSPWVEVVSMGSGGSRVRGRCLCGWFGSLREIEDEDSCEDEVIDHASFETIPLAMPLPVKRDGRRGWIVDKLLKGV